MPAGVGTAVLKSSVLHQSPGCRLGMSKRQTHIQSQMIIKKNEEDIDCKNELKWEEDLKKKNWNKSYEKCIDCKLHGA